jgi:UDP-N-acetylglucosamine--N-acetylmuramyl-(pentapeptide) pyrophosphoryl-undecaprenol N-acetylglucosamine transferase
MSTPTIIFAGGGTGGHLYPGLAIAEELATLGAPSSLFLCSDRPLDAKILTEESAKHTVIPAKPFGLSPRVLGKFLTHWGLSVRTSRAVLQDVKKHNTPIVVAMGGFVAAPVAQAARVERCPVILVNLDAAPGRANRWIAKRTKVVFTAAQVPDPSWRRVRPIVRAAARAPGTPQECRTRLGLDPSKPTLFITGASQGARSLNELGAAIAHSKPDLLRGWQVIHQTGDRESTGLKEIYTAAGIPAVVEPYFRAMGVAWGAADLALSRAGAGSVGEAWANTVPTIFLPYPYHKDEHQKHNAEVLVQAGAAVCVTDRIRADANLSTDAQAPGSHLLALLSNPDQRLRMKHAYATLGPTDGAAEIAREILATGCSPQP